MEDQATVARWQRLIALLAPIHARAMATARRLCRSSADGDDLYQETVLRAFAKLHTLREDSRFPAWFHATLLSRHRSWSRRRFWRRFSALEEIPAVADLAGEDGRRWPGEMERAHRAAGALASLAAVQREAVVLFELDGFSVEEIANMQRVSVSAVKSRLARGRERLRRYYERRGWSADVLGEEEKASRSSSLENPQGSRRPPRAGEAGAAS